MATNYHQSIGSQEHEEHQHDAAARRVTNVPLAESWRVDQVGNTLYVGRARFGAQTSDPVWQILRIQTIGTETIGQYAEGSLEYTKVWNDRASLSYTN